MLLTDGATDTLGNDEVEGIELIDGRLEMLGMLLTEGAPDALGCELGIALGDDEVDGALLGHVVVETPLHPEVRLTSSSSTSDQRPSVSSIENNDMLDSL